MADVRDHLALTLSEDPHDSTCLGAYLAVRLGSQRSQKFILDGAATLMTECFATNRPGKCLVPVLLIFGIDQPETERTATAMASCDQMIERHPALLTRANSETQLIYFIDQFGVPYELHLCPTRAFLGPDKFFTPNQRMQDLRHMSFYPRKRTDKNPFTRLQAAAIDPAHLESLRQKFRPPKPGLEVRLAETWVDDWLQARYTRYRAASGRWVQHGPYVRYGPAGQVKAEIVYRQGFGEGLGNNFHDNGLLAAEGYYQRGELHGVSRYWNSEGVAEPSARFVKGVEVKAEQDGVSE